MSGQRRRRLSLQGMEVSQVSIEKRPANEMNMPRRDGAGHRSILVPPCIFQLELCPGMRLMQSLAVES